MGQILGESFAAGDTGTCTPTWETPGRLETWEA